MVMEAMRLSLLEHEEQQRKEAEAKKKQEAERLARGEQPNEDGSGSNEAGPSSTTANVELPAIPTTSPIDVQQLSRRGLHSDSGSSSERRSVSNSPRSSPASNNPLESGLSSRHPASSPLSTLVASSLGVTSAHSGSRSHSRSGSATPSIRAPTPRENSEPPVSSTLNAALAAQGTATEVLAGGKAETAESGGANVPDPSTSSTIAGTHTPEPQSGTTAARNEEIAAAGSSTVSPGSVPQAGDNRSLTSIFTTNAESQSYADLPSSPDSPSRRPLLLETPASEEPMRLPGPEVGQTQSSVAQTE